MDRGQNSSCTVGYPIVLVGNIHVHVKRRAHQRVQFQIMDTHGRTSIRYPTKRNPPADTFHFMTAHMLLAAHERSLGRIDTRAIIIAMKVWFAYIALGYMQLCQQVSN